ncbi:GNAT family N-acetyltransferase [Psychrosphaera sp. F3M07]|nr:GNAT family N-acetyltransferase [Psychrosphaera sp. F3M07]
MLLKLTTPTESDINTISQWFPDEIRLRTWSGPKFRYPFTQASFYQDLSMERLPSFCLKYSEKNECVDTDMLVGFGQYYSRVGRCHLGRLVINPECRGQNKIADLIHLLAHEGCAQLKADMLSLFVFHDNHKAKNAYQKLGFVEAEYPEEMPMDGCVYMVKQYKS